MASNDYQFRQTTVQSPSTPRVENLNMAALNENNRESPPSSNRSNIGVQENQRDPSYLNGYNSSYYRNNALIASLRGIAREYEIQMDMAKRLLLLRDFEIVIVCDDSGSMKTTVDKTQRTRWDELRAIVKIVVEIGVKFDSNGVDIYFLNRGSFLKVKDHTQVDQVFDPPPCGYTPLVPVLKKIFESPLSQRGRDKKLLVFIATDGVPTDQDGNPNVEILEDLMRNKRKIDTTYVSFLVCTDDPACVDYLNEWDETMPHVDVTDDFYTERDQIRQYRGRNYPFTIGDYVVKALVGAIDPEIDAIDEPS